MRSFDVVIIGSGFGGQCAAKALLDRGIDDFVILERRPFLGGTWKQNRYPGAAVDVQSPLYSIASEPFEWSRMFAERDELERYTDHVLESNGLPARTQVDTDVRKIEWAGDHWTITTSRGDYAAKFVVNGQPGAGHSGMDIAVPTGTPVKAPAAGVVTFAGPDLYLTGGTLLLDHGYGVSSNFLHLSRIDVKVGDRVEQGQVIAAVGATGRATGPHLHWGMNWFDTRIDPLLVLERR